MTRRVPEHLRKKVGRKPLPPEQQKRWTLAELQSRCFITLRNCWEFRQKRRLKSTHSSPRNTEVITVRHAGKAYLVRRLAWLLMTGKEAPEDKGLSPYVCANKRCCNPLHCKPVTERERARAAAARGSFSTPERRLASALGKQASPTAKLDRDKVLRIRAIEGPAHLHAAAFGISAGMFNRVRARKSWANVE